MGWEKIGTAVLLVAMLIFIFPRMRHALKHSPKGSASDWKGFLLPLAGVILFVVFLIMMVR
ncbi:MAG: hypothetical protein R6X06_10200 [Gammaproteobacteria bacterium]